MKRDRGPLQEMRVALSKCARSHRRSARRAARSRRRVAARRGGALERDRRDARREAARDPGGAPRRRWLRWRDARRRGQDAVSRSGSCRAPSLRENGSCSSRTPTARRRRRARRVVAASDDPDVVIDDALAAARSLAGSGVDVVVAPTREAALISRRAAATSRSSTACSRHRRAGVDHAVLVLDGVRCAPPGKRELPAGGRPPRPAGGAPGGGRPRCLDRSRAGGREAIALGSTVEAAVSADLESRCLGWSISRRANSASCSPIAHPERVLRSLEARGVRPSVVIRLADHARFDLAELASHRVDAWLTTERCATKLPSAVGEAPRPRAASWSAVRRRRPRTPQPGLRRRVT